MPAGEGVAGGGHLGIPRRLDELGPDPGPVGTDGELDYAVDHLSQPECGNIPVAPFFVQRPEDDKGQERHNVHGKFGDQVEKFIKHASRRVSQILQ